MGGAPSRRSPRFEGPPPNDKYLEWADLRVACGPQPTLPANFNPSAKLALRNLVDLNVALMQRILKAVETFSFWEADVSQSVLDERTHIYSRTFAGEIKGAERWREQRQERILINSLSLYD
jgi:hypothetical protein